MTFLTHPSQFPILPFIGGGWLPNYQLLALTNFLKKEKRGKISSNMRFGKKGTKDF
jgi:hypothetical protein